VNAIIGWTSGNSGWCRWPIIEFYSIGNDGHVFEVTLLDCPDDWGAIESARQLVYDNDIELRQQDRLITKFTIAKFTGKPE
jgi:hypothetical protein